MRACACVRVYREKEYLHNYDQRDINVYTCAFRYRYTKRVCKSGELFTCLLTW